MTAQSARWIRYTRSSHWVLGAQSVHSLLFHWSVPLTNMADEHEICGFNTIQVKFDESTEASHVLYLKPHSVREEDDRTPSERTLFVLNVPSYCNKVSYSFCGLL